MNDPIVDEVRKVRDAHAARFNYDLDAIFRDIKEQERKSGRTFISFPPRRVEPSRAQQPTGDANSVSSDPQVVANGPITDDCGTSVSTPHAGFKGTN